MRDFDAAVGDQVSQHTCLGKFDYGNMNPREEKLNTFCEQYEPIISNTLYPNQRRYTWEVPGDIRRLQIN